MQKIKAAVVQDAPVVFDSDATIAKVGDILNEAAKLDAQLVVLPEAFVSAYPVGLDFGARVGFRSPEGREDFRRYYESAVAVPGPATEKLGKAAETAGVFLVIGVIERDGGTLYCTSLSFGPDGDLLNKHRKLMPTAAERLIWGFGDGSTMEVVDTPLGRLGSVICWENYMPFLRMHMFAQGVQLYCAPTADSRDTWLSTMRHIALEGRCFVLSACQYLTRNDCPEDYAALFTPFGDDTAETVLMKGGACIIDPLGQVLVQPDFESSGIFMAELDLDRIPQGKYDFDAVGHYSRPDIFRLYVDTSPKPVVVVHSGDFAGGLKEESLMEI
ncbi:MAG: carbon-nitrogen hydrolase family protein [Proteobacteria bacterium]|nr:carbon-nitrogen hydrolase family protein [Pseudomonadota bacterium]